MHKTRSEINKIISEVKLILGKNLIESSKIRKKIYDGNGIKIPIRGKNEKGLVMIMTNKGKYEHTTPDATEEDFYIRTLWGMLNDKRFYKNRAIVRAYRGLKKEFTEKISGDIDFFNAGELEKCNFLNEDYYLEHLKSEDSYALLEVLDDLIVEEDIY